jgi:hypothetical protein
MSCIPDYEPEVVFPRKPNRRLDFLLRLNYCRIQRDTALITGLLSCRKGEAGLGRDKAALPDSVLECS